MRACVLCLLVVCSIPVVGAGDSLTPDERRKFYHLAEGSEIFPLRLIWPLERPGDSGEMFMKDLERFGLIPDPQNPDRLPVGLTAEITRDARVVGNVRMIGVNCAACHVTEITHSGNRLRVDGAPARFDIEAFYKELATAVKETADKKNGKLARYLWRLAFERRTFGVRTELILGARTLNIEKPVSDADQRAADLINWAIESEETKIEEVPLEKQHKDFKPRELETGPVAETIMVVQPREPLTKKQKDALEKWNKKWATAQPETPHFIAAEANPFTDLWSTIKLLKSRAAFLLALARSESDSRDVDGLHGRTDAFGRAREFIFGAKNSIPTNAPVDYPHLWSIGTTAWLHWDANTDSILERNIGQAIGLGAIFNPDDFASTVMVRNIHELETIARKLTPPKWDDSGLGFEKINPVIAQEGKAIFEAKCANCHSAAEPLKTPTELGVSPFRAESFATPLKDGSVFSTKLKAALGQVKLKVYDYERVTPGERAAWDKAETVWRTEKMYPARPLVGLWASAPYLHNGSVPTLADLLLIDVQKRPETFQVGQREYDPVRVGFKEVPKGTLGTKEFNTRIEGNSNAGHLYGTDLPNDDKKKLLEYLKSL